MKLLKCSGYLLYTVVVVFFLLWYKFPADAFKARIEKDLNMMTPTLQWGVKKISLVPPFNVQLRHISITGKKEQERLLEVQSVNLIPDPITWKQTGNIAGKYRLNLLNGTVTGHLALTKDRSALEYDGTVQDVQIDNKEPAFIQQDYQRTLHGTLSGNFSGTRKLKKKHQSLQGQFTFAKGELSLQQPVLGMKQIDFDRIETQLAFSSGTISLSQGKVNSPLFAADFQGSLHTTVPCSLSRIDLKGFFRPRAEFASSIDSPSLVMLLKKEMQQGNLPFTVNGLLKAPGIKFTSLPPTFNNQMGLIRKQLRQMPQGGPAK
ncbi:MAG: type II secretion system protein GspN [Candidatus Electrothrix sp. GW3-4]|uniref:type II secretion system protein GspN n=1 Tax=Candidatus Electrothrix sp. GW3-4 TaxID=3126740 RepID=UPI0030D1F56E